MIAIEDWTGGSAGLWDILCCCVTGLPAADRRRRRHSMGIDAGWAPLGNNTKWNELNYTGGSDQLLWCSAEATAMPASIQVQLEIHPISSDYLHAANSDGSGGELISRPFIAKPPSEDQLLGTRTESPLRFFGNNKWKCLIEDACGEKKNPPEKEEFLLGNYILLLLTPLLIFLYHLPSSKAQKRTCSSRSQSSRRASGRLNTMQSCPRGCNNLFYFMVVHSSSSPRRRLCRKSKGNDIIPCLPPSPSYILLLLA